MKYIQIFLGFFRAGMLCFGGGPASIPFVHREAVVRYQWMDEEAFSEAVAIGNTLPGPINTKLAGYIGWRVGGFWGLLCAVLAAVLPTAILMIVLMTTLSHFSEHPWARGMTRAMFPVVGAMLGIMGWQFLALAAKGLRWPVAVAHFIVAGVLVWFFNIHPAIILAGLFLWAFFGHKITALLKRGEQS
ncbi:MAG: chromate transporter [Defluviitaleaceae bacterium]|nr:chromate transporter [Defluviitaleaceae bacterium]